MKVRAVLLLSSIVLAVGAVELPEATVVAAPTPLAADATVEDWPCFLGPRHDGTSNETKVNLSFPATGPKLLWSLPCGSGYASPVIAKGKLVIQHRVGDENVIECLQPDNGTRLWAKTFPVQYRDRFGYNDGPRSSPVIDVDQVLTYSQTGELRALSFNDGEVLWERDLSGDFNVPQNFFGVGTTPLVVGETIIVNVGAPDGPCVVGLNRKDGTTLWKSAGDWGPSYATPVPATVHGKERVFVFAGGESRPPTGGLMCLDPKTGAVDFQFPWRSNSYESVNASCPVVIGNQVLITSSYQTGAALLTLAPDLQPTTAWTSDAFAVHFATPIHVDGYVYSFSGRNHPDVEMTCVELKTGKVMWSEQPQWEDKLGDGDRARVMKMSPFRGQFLRVGGKFLCLGEEGHLITYDLSPQTYKELHRAWVIHASESWTPPVLSHGLLYLCQNQRGHDGSPTQVLCYDLRAP